MRTWTHATDPATLKSDSLNVNKIEIDEKITRVRPIILLFDYLAWYNAMLFMTDWKFLWSSPECIKSGLSTSGPTFPWLTLSMPHTNNFMNFYKCVYCTAINTYMYICTYICRDIRTFYVEKNALISVISFHCLPDFVSALWAWLAMQLIAGPNGHCYYGN